MAWPRLVIRRDTSRDDHMNIRDHPGLFSDCRDDTHKVICHLKMMDKMAGAGNQESSRQDNGILGFRIFVLDL